MTIQVKPDLTYTCVLKVYHRKRKPPRMEPPWFSSLNAKKHERTRTGLGSTAPNITAESQLAATLGHAQKYAEEQGTHLLAVTIQIHTESGWDLVARWSHWSQEWRCDRIVVES